jgi:hypothetical protein
MSPPPTVEFPLDWVDGLIASIRPHVMVRAEDRLLILLPNQSYQLNPMGVRLMQGLLAGARLSTLLGEREPPARVRQDLFQFFSGIAALVKGCFGEGRGRPECETIEYRRPFNLLPVLSEVALTYRCNVRCRFCYAGPDFRDHPS